MSFFKGSKDDDSSRSNTRNFVLMVHDVSGGHLRGRASCLARRLSPVAPISDGSDSTVLEEGKVDAITNGITLSERTSDLERVVADDLHAEKV